MSPTELTRADHLSHIPLFSGCSKAELKHLSGLTQQITVPSGKVLVKQGSQGFELFVLADGVATVSVDSTVLAKLTSGDVFGELALLDKGVRSAQVESETQCTLIILAQRDFLHALDTMPRLGMKIMENLAVRLRNTNKLVVDD